MTLIGRKRVGRRSSADAIVRYIPGDTPYPYRDCLKEVKRTGNVAVEQHRYSDREERSGAQVDILRMALETIAAQWIDPGDRIDSRREQAAEQRLEDQKLARLALKHARALDDDRTKLRANAIHGIVGKR